MKKTSEGSSLIRDLTINQQITIGFTLVLVLLILCGGFGFLGADSITRNATEVVAGNRLDGVLAQREVDHLNWVNKVNALLTDDSIHTLEVETDDHKCGLGQWLYGEGRKEAERLVPSLAPLLKALEQPHANLHQSAIKIKEQYRPADHELSTFLHEKTIDHLHWMNTVRDAFLRPESTGLTVQMDHTQCGLGKWLYSPETAERKRGSPEIDALITAIEEPHLKLHQSAREINAMLGKGQRREAIAFFNTSTSGFAKETLANIEQVLTWLDQGIEGLEVALRTYNETTLPALAQTQGTLHRIRAEAKEKIMTDQVMLDAAAATKLRVAILALIALGVGLFISRALAVRLTNILGRAATDIQASSTQVAAAAEEISSSSQMLSDTASEQASVVEETSSSLEQISSQSQQTVTLTKGSAELMKENIKKSGQSLKALAALTQNMTDIERDSGQIRSIIATIDSIAFQTNLLALNAAVEAARAGEAGAGFAVVADEVKNLAMKTAQEANQIQQLLDATVARITACAGSLKNINNDFDDIVETATMIGDKNDAVTEATAQQSKGVEQINAATNESADATQRIAAAAEEAAAASEELSAQSEELKEVVASLERLVYGRKAGQQRPGAKRRNLQIGHDREG